MPRTQPEVASSPPSPPPPPPLPSVTDLIAEDARLTAAKTVLQEQEIAFAYHLYQVEKRQDLRSFTAAVRERTGPDVPGVEEWARRVYWLLVNAASFLGTSTNR